MQSQASTYKHDAFISYSRKNEPFAAKLEQALEKYKPASDLKVPQRHLEIFRDKNDFTGGEYHQSLDRHLNESAKLIVICSPAAYKSRYVNDEIRRFAQTRGADHIIPVLYSGIPNNEARPEQTEEMAFPEALCEVLKMPLAINYLGFDTQKDRINKGIFSDAWHTTLANIYGVSRSEVEQREKKRRARARRITYGVLSGSIAVLSILLFFALISRSQAVAARSEAEKQRAQAEQARDAEEKQRQRAEEQTVVAEQQRDIARKQTVIAEERRLEAERQKNIAQEQRAYAVERQKIAVSRGLAAQALNQMGTRLDLALLLAVESTRPASTAEARSSLVKVLQSAPGLVTFLHGHTGPVTRLAFSPNGKIIASGGADQTVRLWSVEGRPLLDAPLYVHTQRSIKGSHEIRALAFSPDGSLLASGSLEGTARFADIKSLKPLEEELEFGGTVSTIVFTADSKQAAFGAVGPRGLLLYDIESGKIAPFSSPPEKSVSANAAAFSPDGRLIALHRDDFQLEGLFLFDVATRKPVSSALAEKFPLIETIVFSPDGKLFAAGARDGTVRIWNVESRQPIGQPLRGEGIVLGATFSKDGSRLAWARSDGSVRVWEIGRWRADREPIFTGALSSMAFSPDGHLLALGGADGSIRIWDTESGRHPLGKTVSTDGWLDGVAFSPDGKLLATGGDHLTLWDVASQRQIRSLPDTKVLSLAFGPQGRTLVTAGQNGVRIWDLATDKAFTIPSQEKEPYNWSLAMTPDGKVIAFGGKTLTLWDTLARKNLRSLPAGKGSIYAVAISADGHLLAAAGEDKQIRLWHLATGEPVGNPIVYDEAVWALAFSRDGRFLASGGNNGKLRLWDARTLQPLGDPLPGHQSRIRSISFSPDGTLMASGGSNRTLLVFDLATREPLGDPLLNSSEHEVVSGVAFSPDGKLLVTSERRKTLYFFDGGQQAWNSRACRIANRTLTGEEWSRYVSGQADKRGRLELPGQDGVTYH